MKLWQAFLLASATVFGIATAFPPQAHALLCSPGNAAEVLWKGNWYPAVVKRAQSNRCYIHYNGYGNNWDEWVGADRIRVVGATNSALTVVQPGAFQVGSPVSVHWGHQWWPAQVLKTHGNQLYIHYDGYGNNWNEWVGPSRYRAP